MHELLYLPVSADLPPAQLARLANEVRAYDALPHAG